MKGFIVLLLCLFCLTGCGYSLQGSWKGGPGEQAKMEFRSDGSILEQGQKAEGLTWHGDYICLKVDTKKMRDAQTEQLTRQKKQLVDQAESTKKYYLAVKARAGTAKPSDEQLDKQIKEDEEQLARQVKPIEQQLEDLKNGKVMDPRFYFPMAMGVDKKDISESSDKVEVRIHWVDADHFDLGSTSFVRVKEKN